MRTASFRAAAMSLLLLFGVSFRAISGNGSIVIGDTVRIHSSVLNEERRLIVCLPRGYESSNLRYPVAYVLDGETQAFHTAGAADFLSGAGLTPGLIVVGISNTDRTRDLTPPTSVDTTHQFPTSGGASHFAEFISRECVPYINTHYRTAGFKILVGHSFGGLFAVHTLLTTPGMFDAYIAISPSLWWNNRSEVAAAREFLRQHPDPARFLYLTLGNEGNNMADPLSEFTKTLESNAAPDFRWKYERMMSESHGSISHRSVYDGLQLLFAPTVYAIANADSGIEKMERHFASASKVMGFKIDPPENTVNTMGYVLLGEKKIADAITMFKYNLRLYPASANPHDSMADGYEANKQFEPALEESRKACQLGEQNGDPNLPLYRQHLEKLLKETKAK